VFAIEENPQGDVVLSGRLDAVSVPVAREFLERVTTSKRLDFSRLEYIGSVGLGVLAAAQRRLMGQGEGLTLAGLNPHLREVFEMAGFLGVFNFE
jgi:stage II sporulation protein AA (anti-sigma F factor antagonist)